MRNLVVAGIVAGVIVVTFAVGNTIENGPNPFLVGGLVNGTIFGLMAIGLVLVYKGTRVFNFAQAEFGTIAAFLLAVFLNRVDLPYWASIFLALAATVLLGLIIERLFLRPLLTAPRVTVLVATIAVALLAIGAELLIFGIEPLDVNPIVGALDAQGRPTGIEVFQFHISPQGLISVGMVAGLGALLAYFFSRTDLGLAVLGTSQDAFATRVVGIGVDRMSRFIWGAAAALGAIAGILYAPQPGFVSPGLLTQNLLIPAFTAAVLGGMTSLPGAFLGGIVIGFVSSLAGWAADFVIVDSEPLAVKVPGMDQLAILLVLLIVLLVRPQGLLGREA
jgi:branched-chain amino acid transport system permease protein